MTRPRLGSAAKDQPVTVRMTSGEKALLQRIYGTPSKGLRALIDQLKYQQREQAQKGTP